MFVYKIKKSALLKTLEKKRITQIKKLTKGHRGVIFTGLINKIKTKADKKPAKTRKKEKPDKKINASLKVAIKSKLISSAAMGNIEREALWLKKLNTHKIGPKLLFSGKEFFCYEFVEGEFIADFFDREKNKKILKRVITTTFAQCFQLDKLGIDKEEMHHPYKHVLIGKTKQKKNSITLIDFERAHFTENPKNVTQFCTYIISSYVSEMLNKRGFNLDKNKLISLAQVYKKKQTKANLNLILNQLKNA